MSLYPGNQDRRSLEHRLENLERTIGRPSVEVARTVVVNTSSITSSGPSTSTGLGAHVRAADPHSQYQLESASAVLEGRIATNETDIEALDVRVTAVEASVQDLLDSQPRSFVPSGETFLIPEGRQVAVYGTLTVEGDVTLNGELVVHG